MLILHTDRLELIPINVDLAPEMFQVLKDSSLYEYVTGLPPADVAALARQYKLWERRRSPDETELWLNWALRLRDDKHLIGHMQAGVLPDHAYVAWFLGVRWQQLGFATEAARAVVDLLLRRGVHEIRASINPIHSASMRVAERLGLQRTNEFNDGELIWKRVYETSDGNQRKSG